MPFLNYLVGKNLISGCRLQNTGNISIIFYGWKFSKPEKQWYSKIAANAVFDILWEAIGLFYSALSINSGLPTKNRKYSSKTTKRSLQNKPNVWVTTWKFVGTQMHSDEQEKL